MSWTRSIDLIHWADHLEARGQMPHLLRRLVQSTVPSVESCNFPAWEQVQRPGFDGEVEASQGNQFVPAGRSGWEMGVTKDVKEKAETSGWRSVIALDANDLEHWLETAPDIDAWFTRLIGHVTPGVHDLES